MLKIICAVLFLIWLVLVIVGKGGFVHLILLVAIGVSSVEVMTMLRSRLKV